ncbi:MAG: hypothetical protein J6X42_01595 [Alphaproteobacteria bacterium]|nr:hypothetical protein [Alphaproteobacteria bacterium]
MIKSNESGRTFVEVLAYIMVMVAVTVSLAAAVSRGYYKYESSEVQLQLSDLKKAISMRYAADGNYMSLKLDDLCADLAGPHSMMPRRKCETQDGKEVCGCETQGMYHVFDGKAEIGHTDDGLMFFIKFSGLPTDICVQLATKDWDLSEGSDLDHMIINDTKTWSWQYSPLSETDDDAYELPALVEDALSACSRDGYSNKIVWYFN